MKYALLLVSLAENTFLKQAGPCSRPPTSMQCMQPAVADVQEAVS